MTKRQEHGFTLIEVLVALLILALASGAAFQAISGGANSLRRSRGERDAIALAESTLAQVGHTIATQPAHLTGTKGVLSWVLDVGNQIEDPTPASGLAAYPVRVAVHWQDDRRRQEIHLDSVRLGPPQPDTP